MLGAIVLGFPAILAPVPAGADAAEPEDVRVPVKDGVVINWTRLTLEASAAARGHGVASSRRTVEQQARGLVAPGILAGARAVRVDRDRTFADLEQDEALAEALRSRVLRWNVTEARYYASGKVELLAELPLQELLKPWTLSVARPAPVDATEPGFTGLVVDARGLGVGPAFAPVIRDDEGQSLYDGLVWEDHALREAPVLYVRDPSHPAASRAGDHPLVLRAVAADGPDLVLAGDDLVRFRTALSGSRRLGEGRVVVVID